MTDLVVELGFNGIRPWCAPLARAASRMLNERCAQG